MWVAIIGSRTRHLFEKDEILRHIPVGCSGIISGGAAGVDALAEIVAAEQGISFRKILPDYSHYGRTAPLVRNAIIVEKADLVLAFWDFHSRGTANTIAACIEKQVPVKIIGPDKMVDKKMWIKKYCKFDFLLKQYFEWNIRIGIVFAVLRRKMQRAA